MQRTLLLAATAAAFGLAGCASDGDMAMHHGPGMHHGTGMGAAAAPSASRLAAPDLHFVLAAAGTDLYEIQASQMAMSRATTPAVRNYAQMLVNHHTMTSNELKGIVSAKGVTPPTTLPADKAAKIAQLSRLQGHDFEREYIRMTGVQDHQAAIGIFDNASRTLADPDLRNFAVKGLPILRQHLKAAQDIAGTMAG